MSSFLIETGAGCIHNSEHAQKKTKLLCFIIDCQRGILLIAMSALYKKNVDIQ